MRKGARDTSVFVLTGIEARRRASARRKEEAAMRRLGGDDRQLWGSKRSFAEVCMSGSFGPGVLPLDAEVMTNRCRSGWVVLARRPEDIPLQDGCEEPIGPMPCGCQRQVAGLGRPREVRRGVRHRHEMKTGA